MGVYLSLPLFALMLSGMSIALGVDMAAALTIGIREQIELKLIFQQHYQGVDSFALLVVPLSMFTGELTTRLGLVGDIILLTKLLIGRIRGSLAQINVVASAFFPTVFGSTAVGTATTGGVLLPVIEEEGHGKEFSVAITVVSSVIGPIIPPSVTMTIYGSLMLNVLTGAMFVAGIVPGVLIRLGEIALVYCFSRKRNYPRETKRYTVKEASAIAVHILLAVLTPVVIVATIFSDSCSVTETACIANIRVLTTGTLYYRRLNLKVFGKSVIVAVETAGAILLLNAVAKSLNYLIAVAQLPTMISEAFTSSTSSKIVILLLVNMVLLPLGCSMGCITNILIFTPISAPLAISFGVDPLQFALIFVANVVCNTYTPPFGPAVFLTAGIAKAPLERCMKAIIPFCVVQIAVILVVSYIPALALTLPRLLGPYQSMSMTEEAIRRFVSTPQWQDIPEAVKGCARRCFTDTMACIISGGESVQFQVAEAVIDQDYAPRHHLARQGLEQVNLYDSVLLSAYAAHSEKYNNLFSGRPGHPNTVLVPVVLGLGFSQSTSTNSVMESYVTDLEIMVLVNRALLPSAHKMGFHTISVAGVVGATAVADKLLYLSQDGLKRTPSIACTSACGPRADFGTLVNVLHVGNAAAAGSRATQFAAAGFYTGTGLLSGSFLIYYGGPREQLGISAGSLGQTRAFLGPGLLVKKHPCHFSNYQAIEAVLNITEIPGFPHDRIGQVVCLIPGNHFMSLPVFWPDIPYGVRFCIPYCVAVTLLQGNIDEASLNEKMLHNTALLHCRDRIRYDMDPRQRGEKGFGYSRIIVAQGSGQRFETVSWLREGERIQCWDKKFLKNKFLNCHTWMFSKIQTQRVYGICMHIDELRGTPGLLCVLCGNEMPEGG